MTPKQENRMTPDEKAELEKLRAESIARQGEVDEMEDELYSASAPKGRFTSKAANALVDAANRLLPLFGISDKYEKMSGDMTTLPPAFVRMLMMFKAAIDDAVAEGALPEDAVIDLKMVTDDTGLQSLAGRIGMAAKSPAFKRFLSKKTTEERAPMSGEPEEDSEEMSEEMGSEDTDKLMMERM